MGSYLAVVYSWRTLSGESGIINSLLQASHVTSAPVEFLLFSRIAVVIAEVNFFLPLTTLRASSRASPRSRPGSSRRSRDLGASAWTTLRRITLRWRGTRCSGPRCSCSSSRRGTTSRRCSSAGSARARRSGRLIADQLGTTLNYPLGRGDRVRDVRACSLVVVVVLPREHACGRSATEAHRMIGRSRLLRRGRDRVGRLHLAAARRGARVRVQRRFEPELAAARALAPMVPADLRGRGVPFGTEERARSPRSRPRSSPVPSAPRRRSRSLGAPPG